MRRKQYLSRLLIPILAFTLFACKSSFVGKYEVYDGFFGYKKNFLLLYKNGTYRLLFPSVESHHKNGFLESEGTWDIRDKQIILNSFNQPKYYDLLYVIESNKKNEDSVYFEFYVKNRDIDTVYETPPAFTIGGLELSEIDTIFNLNKNPLFAYKWNHEKNRFFLVSDVMGYLAPYYVINKKSNHFTVYYFPNDFEKPRDFDFFLNEKLKIKNDTLIYRKNYKFIKVGNVPKGL